jgi:hypothetical protein
VIYCMSLTEILKNKLSLLLSMITEGRDLKMQDSTLCSNLTAALIILYWVTKVKKKSEYYLVQFLYFWKWLEIQKWSNFPSCTLELWRTGIHSDWTLDQNLAWWRTVDNAMIKCTGLELHLLGFILAPAQSLLCI